ncbi:ISAs1 family transposase [Testudinibacter aquarius]|uniref:ISAs1 family transposase n=1 Tax=Testudinibacter aquarius TaxID=1524974 RepID=A0A4R3XXA9_9PAST|nr:ISAs1 family transposase [Testudinibacter aquarius]KAE9529972.1 hypothetical protein A1D24_07735 [Testudinibacter aquarius]TCV83870.1 putative transposase YbfD/YdcC [Testudinibacter aquarius]TNG89716.1 ISAs1 family transposase [Testudinibacter aquarius]
MDFFHFFAQPETENSHDSQPCPILELAFLTMSAVISGAKTWQDIRQFGEQHLCWLRHYLPFAQGIPSEATIAALLSKLHPSQFNDIFINFINELRQAKQLAPIPLDGKNLRNSFGHEAKSALHTITLQPKPHGLIVAQPKAPRWRNEQQGVLEVLAALRLRRAIVSVYACNTQKKIVRHLWDKQADYVVALNNNHRAFRQEIAAYFHKMERKAPQSIEDYHDLTTGQQYKQLPVGEWLTEPMQWGGINVVLCVEPAAQLTLARKSESNAACYISSLKAGLPQFAESIRRPWGA